MSDIAIVKPISVRQCSIAGLRAVIEYIKDGTKTKNGDLVFAFNCLKGREFQQMLITKIRKRQGKDYPI